MNTPGVRTPRFSGRATPTLPGVFRDRARIGLESARFSRRLNGPASGVTGTPRRPIEDAGLSARHGAAPIIGGIDRRRRLVGLIGRVEAVSAEVWLDALGARVQVRCPQEMLPALREQWRHCLIERPGRAPADEVIDLVTDADRRTASDAEEADLQLQIRTAEYRVASISTVTGIGIHRGARLMLHAAGVGDPLSGRVAALVAASGTGKTTASARLSAAGLAYLTDEAVAIDEFFLALPYPKPLSVVVDPDRPLDKSQHGPDELGMDVLQGDAEIGAVVLLRRDPSRQAAPRLSEVDPLDAVLALIPQTSALPSLHRPLARVAALLRHVGGVQALDYRDIEDAAALLRRRLRGPAERNLAAERTRVIDPTGAQRWSEESAPTAAPKVPHARTTDWVRGPFTQALHSADRVIVLAGAEPFSLDGVGATLWLFADEPRSVTDLVVSAIEQLARHRMLVPANG